MKINQCTLIGGGPSIKEGIKKDLWNKIKWKFTIGLNYSFNYFPSTILSFVDEKFYKDELEKLKSLPLIIGKESTRTQDIKLPNTILLKNSHEYKGLNSIKENKIYCSQLVGVFALTLAICLMEGEGEIFLLGYDFGDNGKEDDKKRKITHFYQDKIDHRGVGKVSFYDTKDRARKLFSVYKNEKVRIYNVSLNSKIPEEIFPKISYDEFFKLLDSEEYCQIYLRNKIKKELINIL
jgi:hypothetical protein